jgi:hypothetical protein
MSHKVLRGITYGDKRAEVGEIVTDIPEGSIEWLLESGVIEPVDGQPKQAKKPKAKSEPVSDDKGDE